MQDTPPLAAAVRRLAAALDQLEAAVERRLAQERRHAGLEAQVQALGVDRARLASELDQMQASRRRAGDRQPRRLPAPDGGDGDHPGGA